MKNLNKKLSVIALSGMAVFGGVAVSGIQAFAAGNEVVVEQEVQDEVAAELDKLILKSGFSYKVLHSNNSKDKAREVMKEKYGGSSRLNNYAPSVKKSNIKRYLQKFAEDGARVFVLKYGGKWHVVGLPKLLK